MYNACGKLSYHAKDLCMAVVYTKHKNSKLLIVVSIEEREQLSLD
jgi:hypothetical protein